MSFVKYIYSRINWLNKSESLSTPLGKTNLNHMDSSIYKIAENLNILHDELDTGKFNEADAGKVIVGMPTWDSKTGLLTFKFYDGTEFSVDFNIEKIPVSFSMDSAGVITMTTSDGTKWTADIGDVIPDYVFEDSEQIAFSRTKNSDGSYAISASLVKNSITDEFLQPNYLADITAQADKAESSVNNASEYADNAAYDAKLAQSYSVGKSGVRAGEDTDNAKYYYEQTKEVKEEIESGDFSSIENVKSATKLTTARNIGKASFDGTKDITLEEMGVHESVKTANGNVITLLDASDSPFKGINVYCKGEQDSTTGKNLLGWASDTTPTGVTITHNNDRSITLNGEAIASGYINFDAITLEANTNYVFSANSGVALPTYGARLSLLIAGSDLAITEKISVLVSVTETKEVTPKIYIQVGNVFNNVTLYPQLEVGSEATEYEPYTNGASPNPDYPQEIVGTKNPEIKVSGNQLINKPMGFVGNGSGTANVTKTDYGFSFTANSQSAFNGCYTGTQAIMQYTGKVTVSCDVTISDTNFNYFHINNSPVLYADDYTSGKTVHVEKTLNYNGSVITFYLDNRNKTVGSVVTVSNIMINYGEVALPFEPYNEQTLALNYTGYGIPVESDGNYTDTDGQQWICDEIDLERGVYIQRIATKTYDGTGSWNIQTDELSGTVSFYTILNNIVKKEDNTNIYCNIARASSWEDMISGTISNAVATIENTIGFNFLECQSMTVADFKTWTAVNPIEIYFELATPIETPLTDAEIEAYKALHTNNPNTTISNSADANMVVKYFTNTATGEALGDMLEEINNVVDGNTEVAKAVSAEQDADGNVISGTYAKFKRIAFTSTSAESTVIATPESIGINISDVIGYELVQYNTNTFSQFRSNEKYITYKGDAFVAVGITPGSTYTAIIYHV